MDSITIPVGPRLGDVVVEAEGLCKAYGERVLLDNATFSIPPGSVVGAPGRPGGSRGPPLARRRWHGAAGCRAGAAACARSAGKAASHEKPAGRWRLVHNQRARRVHVHNAIQLSQLSYSAVCAQLEHARTAPSMVGSVCEAAGAVPQASLAPTARARARCSR